MKKYPFLFISLFLSGLTVHAATTQTACTMEYAPVCAEKQVQCITAPCDPIRQTYSNSCMAGADNATIIFGGDCNIAKPTPPVLGGDRDIHGCIGSAGYTWNNLAQQCLRPWESRVRVITIAPNTTKCSYGMVLSDCLQSRTGFGQWYPLYGGISGFDFVSGYTYRLRVLETRLPNPPADGSNLQYSLLRVISKRPVMKNDEALLGDWKLQSYQVDDMVYIGNDLPISFTKDHYSAKFCNTINSTYTAKNGVLTSGPAMSTMMYCEGQVMTLEQTFSLDGASYSVKATSLVRGSTGPTLWLTITTKTGGVFTYGR